MKKLLLLPLMIVLGVGCTTSWYKYDRPLSEVPKSEVEQDQSECKSYARLECAKVGGAGSRYSTPEYRGQRRDTRGPKGYPAWADYQATPFQRCVKIYYDDCLSKRGWHKKRKQRENE
jgi:hypothetical protein